VPYCFEAPALTGQAALRACTGQRAGSGLKFLTEKPATVGLQRPWGANAGIHPLPPSSPVLFHLPLSTFNLNAVVLVNKALPNHFYALNRCKSRSELETASPSLTKEQH